MQNCPRCGKVVWCESVGNIMSFDFVVKCSNCGLTSYSESTQDVAELAWDHACLAYKQELLKKRVDKLFKELKLEDVDSEELLKGFFSVV